MLLYLRNKFRGNLRYTISIWFFSTSSVAFPEVTICPNYLPTPYKFDTLCDKYETCNSKINPETPNLLPSSDVLASTNLTFSEYFEEITFNLNELISRFEVFTKKSINNKRYSMLNY